MVKTGGRQVNIGLGIEATAGTAVAETIFLPWSAFSMQAVSEKAMFNSARGIRNMASNSMIRRKYAQGSLGAILNVENAPYLFGMALGSVATALASGETAVWEHTITVQNANASMKTATLTVEQGAVETTQYTNVVVDSLNVEVSDGYATITAELIGQFPGTDTITESYTTETEMAYHNYTAKFGTTVANAISGSATPLKSFSLNIANNVQLDEAFLSGANTVTSGGLIAGPMQITGSYSLHFEDTTELAKYKANTKNAMVVSFTGASIGVAETEEVSIRLGRLVLTSPPVEYNIDGLLVLNQEFEVEYEATDKEVTVIVTNEANGTNY
jgi:hypothetical protein